MSLSLREKVELLNWCVNQPEVLPKVAPGYEDQDIDLSAFFDNPRNIIFGDRRGVIMFAWHSNDVYEAVYLFSTDMPTYLKFRTCKDALHTMFTKHGARAIIGLTPRENRAARAMNRALGALPVGVADDHNGKPCIRYLLERSAWAKKSANA